MCHVLDPLAKLLACQAAYEILSPTLGPHADAVPLAVMVRGTLEWLLDEPTLDKLFREHAADQYTRELTIHALVGLVIQVAAGIRGSPARSLRKRRSAMMVPPCAL